MTILTTKRASHTYEDLGALLTRITGDEKHAASAHSTLDVLWVIYDRVLRLSPDDPDAPDRDRFLLSKGHGPTAYYAVLAAKGYLDEELLDDVGSWESPLGHHPDRLRVRGVEISSGSLGHGLPLGVGIALGLRAQGFTDPRVYVLLGDAELDEGSNHEAIAYAGATGLDSITAVVIDNGSATHGWPGGIASRFVVNGWSATEVGGRDHDAIERGLRSHDRPGAGRPGAGRPGAGRFATGRSGDGRPRPHVVVARTERKY
jgi:transketolase